MIKNLTITAILLIVINNFLLAQKDSLLKNNIFIEFGGVAAHYSLDFDRAIPINNKLGVNIGLGYSNGLLTENNFSPRLPIQLKLYYKIKRHFFDFGFALTPYVWYYSDKNFSNNVKDCEYAFFTQLGYKCLLKNPHFNFSVAFTPEIFDTSEKDYYSGKIGLTFRPWAAIRFGYNFNFK